MKLKVGGDKNGVGVEMDDERLKARIIYEGGGLINVFVIANQPEQMHIVSNLVAGEGLEDTIKCVSMFMDMGMPFDKALMFHIGMILGRHEAESQFNA